MTLKDISDEYKNDHKYLMGDLRLKSGENYIILNGEIIPFNGLLNEKYISSVNDIWTIIGH